LADGRGALVPFENSDAIAEATIGLLDNDNVREAMSKRAYLYARRMVWNRVAQSYMRTFVSARANCMQPDRPGFSVQASDIGNARQLASA
jgi:glycosyltransferase involved in cell wall biosynthesis